MFSEIWESMKDAFTYIYDKILYRLVKLIYFTFAIFKLFEEEK